MKDLKSTIYEKLDINKVKLKNRNFVKNFPLDGTIEEIINYLKDYNFKDVPWPIMKSFSEFKKDIEKENIRIFTTDEDSIVRFANTSLGNEISDDNPIFVIKNNRGVYNKLYFESGKWWGMTVFANGFLAKMESVFNYK